MQYNKPMAEAESDFKPRSPTPSSVKVQIVDDSANEPTVSHTEASKRKNLGSLTQRIKVDAGKGQDLIILTSGRGNSKQKWKLPLHVNVRI